VPLTRVTFLCGPNGSGKSTFVDGITELIHGQPSFLEREWTRENAPALVEGTGKAVLTFSFEKDNPRTARGHNVSAGVAATMFFAGQQSHGQSNYAHLGWAFAHEDFDVMVLDEPEAALDLDGLLWLRGMLLSTSKQVILATHSVLLLSLHEKPDVSVQLFGTEPNYVSRLIASYQAAVTGKRIPKSKKRLPRPEIDKPVRKKKIRL